MASPDPLDLDSQDDMAEAFDETNLNDEAEFATLEDLPDVYDATQALGDSRDDDALDAADYDPQDLDDEALEADQDVDDRLDDELEDRADGDDLDAEDGVDELQWDEAEVMAVADVDPVTDPDDEEADDYESQNLSDEDLRELGYQDEPAKAASPAGPAFGDAASAEDRGSGARAEDVDDEVHPHQDELLDEGVEETFPASDPVSVKRIT